VTEPEVVVYRQVGGCDLPAHVYTPEGGAKERRPAIVFFHGGGFRTGEPGPYSFGPYCQHLAGRGMVAVDASYRLFDDALRARAARARDPKMSARIERLITARHTARSIQDCVDDALAAVAWLRSRPDVDAERVVSSGYSAGGHLAVRTAMDEASDAASRANALILRNAVIVTWEWSLPAAGSPVPTLILSGTRDQFLGQARRLHDATNNAGGRCELELYEGAHSNLFRARPDNPIFAASLARIDAFLESLGYLQPVDDVAERIMALELPWPAKGQKRAKRSKSPSTASE
jgi:acetyl esterase